MIGLGVGIDYALFILTRFRNGLDEGLEPRPAAIRAVDTAGRAVLFAGIDRDHLADGDAAARHHLPLRGRGRGRAGGAVHDDRRADPAAGAARRSPGTASTGCAIPGPRPVAASSIDENSRWFRWSRAIQRRPALAAVLSGALLLVLCIPTLSLRLGSNDAGTEPGREDHAPGLRPARRRLRTRLQRPVGDGRRSCPPRAKTPVARPSSARRSKSEAGRRRRHPGRPSTRPRTPASVSVYPDDLAAEREDDQTCSTTSATT